MKLTNLFYYCNDKMFVLKAVHPRLLSIVENPYRAFYIVCNIKIKLTISNGKSLKILDIEFATDSSMYQN